MANFAQISGGLQRGYLRGRQTGGGRLGALGGVISKVANRLKEERVSQQELGQKRGLLGYSAQLEGKIEPVAEGDVGGIQIPGMGRFKPIKKPVAYKPTTRKEAESFATFKAGLKPKITKSTALGILSDPIKAEQLKLTYPEIFSRVENIARGDVPIKKDTGRRISVISPDGNIGDIPESQLEQALQEGYKRTIN